MKKNPAKFDRCVKAVKARGSAVDPYAVCTAAGTRNPKKPYKLTKSWEFWLKDGEIYRNARGQRGPIDPGTGMPANVRWESSKSHFDHFFDSVYKGNKGKRNPADEAAEAFAATHGRPSEEVITVTKKIHYHGHLAAMGRLTKIEVIPGELPHGTVITLKDFKGAILAFTEDRTQLYVEGGNQAVDVAAFGIDVPHELQALGYVKMVEYLTRKDHLGKDGGTAQYFHFHKRKYPVLVYDTVNEQLSFAGGQYKVLDEGIEN